MLERIKGTIGNNDVTVAFGDMAAFKVDAYVIPQFRGTVSYRGAGVAVARRGGVAGLESYLRFLEQNGEQDFGAVVLTPSGGGNADFYLHSVSIGSGRDDEFSNVEMAFYNALTVAEQQWFKRIAASAMGTGIIGKLTPAQSARAMMSALYKYGEEGGRPIETSFVIDNDRETFQAFVQALQKGAYKTAGEDAR